MERKLLRIGLVPTRVWGGHAVRMSPTERLKMRRQQQARTRLFHCLFSWRLRAIYVRHWHTSCGGRGVDGQMEKREVEDVQIFVVQTWTQVGGLARAVMCKARDLGIPCPQWHTVLSKWQVAVDVTVVCPQDVKTMLFKQARMVRWKSWATNNDCEEWEEVF